jgi:hypothetical protein
MNIELKENLARIIRTLEGQGMKSTKIAHAIGYTTTTQLYNSIEGKSLLSTKAVIGLIDNLNVNPYYLFLGKGEMFLTGEMEIETLKREIIEKTQDLVEAKKTIEEQGNTIKDLQKKVYSVIDLSNEARQYYSIQMGRVTHIEKNRDEKVDKEKRK